MGLVVLVWFGSGQLGLVIAAAMIVNLWRRRLPASSSRLTLTRAGFDPARASAVFVTMVTDVVGFFAFLGLASLWLV